MAGEPSPIMPTMLLHRLASIVVCAAAFSLPGQSQQVWQMQESGTSAGLRGIDSVDGTVAWASGTGGTVLRTTDDGAHWMKCAVPDGDKDGATLDFRGVQAWDAKTAIVMAGGPGDKSRLYKTMDGCGTWKLVLTNPDKEGFWGALYFLKRGDGKGRGKTGYLLGDPVGGTFWLLVSYDSGRHWIKQKGDGLQAKPATQGAFAASNSSLANFEDFPTFASGGNDGAFAYGVAEAEICLDACSAAEMNLDGSKDKWARHPVPVGKKTETSGIFSISRRASHLGGTIFAMTVSVGGDYTKPNESTSTAAWSADGSEHRTASTTPPHGYRSTVQWSESLKVWITAGTNGSDVSRDDGKTWQPLDDGNWNALSLPFIVGPNGRIARLNAAAIPAAK